jgi:hypothetical protein
MSERDDGRSTESKDANAWWYKTLNMFPFVYLPIVLLVALACALFLPIIRRLAP